MDISAWFDTIDYGILIARRFMYSEFVALLLLESIHTLLLSQMTYKDGQPTVADFTRAGIRKISGLLLKSNNLD